MITEDTSQIYVNEQGEKDLIPQPCDIVRLILLLTVKLLKGSLLISGKSSGHSMLYLNCITIKDL